MCKQHDPAPPEFLTLTMIRQQYLPLGMRHFHLMIALGTFPRPDIATGGKVWYWKRTTVNSWIAALAKGVKQ